MLGFTQALVFNVLMIKTDLQTERFLEELHNTQKLKCGRIKDASS
jgi:hypothetical protein